MITRVQNGVAGQSSIPTENECILDGKNKEKYCSSSNKYIVVFVSVSLVFNVVNDRREDNKLILAYHFRTKGIITMNSISTFLYFFLF